jgi:hypothetical protein
LIVAFGLCIGRPDGLNGWCRACRATAERRRRAADPARHAAKNRARYAAYPAKWHAKVTVARAVAKGVLVKPDHCPSCGEPRPIEAHHTMGYERRYWLVVVWRCRSCHKLEHTRRPVVAKVA